jgi:hypothetical protein
MTPDAVGFSFGIPAPQVLTAGHGLEMIGIHAVANLAEVIQFEALGDWSYELLVGHPVRPNTRLAPFPGESEQAISRETPVGGPQPARLRALDLAPEPAR